MRRFHFISILIAVALILSACGATTPDLLEHPYSRNDTGHFVDKIALHVRCELRDAILSAINDEQAHFLHKWSAKITMSIFADEKTNFTPSISAFSGDLVGTALKSLSWGFGVNYNREATRKVEITWFEVFDDLISGLELKRRCDTPPAEGIEGNLRIAETLFTGVTPATLQGAFFNKFTDNAGPLESIQNTITFEVDTGANFTPTYTFTHVGINPGGTLALGNRERQDQLLITMGPGQIEDLKRPFKKQVIRPSGEVTDAHNTGRFGLELQSYPQGRGL